MLRLFTLANRSLGRRKSEARSLPTLQLKTLLSRVLTYCSNRPFPLQLSDKRGAIQSAQLIRLTNKLGLLDRCFARNNDGLTDVILRLYR